MRFLCSLESTLATNNGRARFTLRASLLAIVPSLLMFGVLVALGIDTLRAPTGTLNPAFIAYSVLLAPLIETAVMFALAAVLARLVPRHVALQIALVAFVTALAHRHPCKTIATSALRQAYSCRVLARSRALTRFDRAAGVQRRAAIET